MFAEFIHYSPGTRTIASNVRYDDDPFPPFGIGADDARPGRTAA